MHVLYMRPSKMRATVKEVKAITITTIQRIDLYNLFIDLVQSKLLEITNLKYCVHKISGILETHKDGMYHFHGVIEICNPVMFFGSNKYGCGSILHEMKHRIGHIQVKTIEDMDTWLNYVTKNEDSERLLTVQFME